MLNTFKTKVYYSNLKYQQNVLLFKYSIKTNLFYNDEVINVALEVLFKKKNINIFYYIYLYDTNIK